MLFEIHDLARDTHINIALLNRLMEILTPLVLKCDRGNPYPLVLKCDRGNPYPLVLKCDRGNRHT